MTILNLTTQQRAELEYLASHCPVAQERCRALALLWFEEGEPVEQIAESLRVSRQTVYNWIHRLQTRPGLDVSSRLADAPRSGRPRSGAGGVDPLIAQVIDIDPRQFGYHETIWTTPLLRQHLLDHHSIDVSTKTIGRAIDRSDLRWKRPRHELALRPDTWRQSKGG